MNPGCRPRRDGDDCRPSELAAARPVAGLSPSRPAPSVVPLPMPRVRRAASASADVGEVALPRFAQIEPVGRCNLRCRMCPIAYRPDGQPGAPPALIEEDVFRRIIDGLPELEELQLQGLGEPLMHPRFFAMVRYAAGRGIRVSTNTNLTLLTPARARACVESGLHTLHASIDGATAETYQFIRRGANFAKVLRNLDRLVAARSALRSTRPDLCIVAVAMRRNLEELADLVILASRHGVNKVFVQHLCHDYGEGSLPEVYLPMRDFVAGENLLDEEPARVASAFSRAREAARAWGVELRLPPLTQNEPRRSKRSPRGCEWPYRGAYVSYRGEAMPCCMVSTPDRARLGNMATDGVGAVWNGPAYRAFRTALASGDPPEVCRGCAIYKGTF